MSNFCESCRYWVPEYDVCTIDPQCCYEEQAELDHLLFEEEGED